MTSRTEHPDPGDVTTLTVTVGKGDTTEYVTREAYDAMTTERDELRRTLAVVSVAVWLPHLNMVNARGVLHQAGHTRDTARAVADIIHQFRNPKEWDL